MKSYANFEDFIRDNGGTYIRSDKGKGESGVWLCPSGATIVNNGTSPQFFDPPPGTEGLRARHKYHTLRLNKIVADFNLLKNYLQGYGPSVTWDSKFYGKYPGDGRDALRLLEGLVRAEREAIQALETAIYDSPEEQHKRAREEENRQLQHFQDSKRRQYLDEISSITI